MFTLKDKEQYQRDGYIVAENVLAETLASDLQNEASQITSQTEFDEQLFVNDIYCGNDWMHSLPSHPAFERLFKLPALLDGIAHLMGAPCELVLWYLHQNPPQVGAAMWHQDLETLPSGAKVCVTLSIHDTEDKKDHLRVLPGSFSRAEPTEEQLYENFADEVALRISNRTAIIHDPVLWHATKVNNSSDNELSLFLFYKMAD
ncbi:phytanoyl-CoA dioxygenase family protein [Stieleria marina]|uniref:Phytanoyl-CoA dioxygenase (PhyH) n=1 Tax=Stieleria marina TaxID=1930275 RepID=A0A517P0K3_9BACT|nr:Phytanoyl-CoA dioxygenase (PhyH) [Planctomycetes bacterium K23_9]